MAPYICVWLVARGILAAVAPAWTGPGHLDRFGWMAVWFAVGRYRAVLCRPYVHPYRRLPHGAGTSARAAMAHVLKLPAGLFRPAMQSGRLRKLIDDNAGLTEDLLAHKLPDIVAATAVTPIAAMLVVLFVFDWRMGLAVPAAPWCWPLLSMCADDGRQKCRLLPPLSKGDRAHERRGGGVCPGHSGGKDVPADGLLLQGLLRMPFRITATWPASTP